MFEGIDIWAALRQPLQMLVDPTERIFLPSVAASVALVMVAFGLRRGVAALRRGLFARRIWSHASTRTDITLLFVKAIVFAVVRIPWVAGTAAAALWVGLTLHDVLGPAPTLHWHPLAVSALYTVVLFVAWDASRFALHWAMHAVPLLWRFHQVHHSAPVLTPLTLHRVHPIESVLYDLRGLVTTALVTGAFLYLFRGSASELQLLGVNAIGLVLNFVGGNLRHSHVWLRFGALERLIISPAQHQLHHGRDTSRVNYGTWLAIWDRLCGSWLPAPARPHQDFGIAEPNHRIDSVLSILLAPFVRRRPG